MGTFSPYMLASEIISKFETYVDDSTELSSTEELALLQKIYDDVWNNRDWAFANTTGTGTLSTSVPYVSLPADFSHLLENNKYTENNTSIENNASPCVIFVGSSYQPYQVVNWSDRRQYLNQDGYAYVDYVNLRLYFTKQPTTADSYEFDYKKNADTLVLGSTPAFPQRFHDILYHGMAVDNEIIQRWPKASSYAPENRAKYASALEDMAAWNARFQMN